MITLDDFLVFLGAVSMTAIYIFIVSRWVEPAYRQNCPEPTAQEARPIAKRDPVPQPA